MDLFDIVMSLLFNMLSRLVTDFLPKQQVSFNFMAAVTIGSDFGHTKIKYVIVPIVSPSISLGVLHYPLLITLKPAHIFVNSL